MRNTILTSLFTFACLILFSQGNSPYSQIGLGNQYNSTFQSNFGMGGLGATYSSKYYINPINPATYAKIKYTIGEFGVYNSNNNYSDGTNNGKASTFNLGNFGFGFPLGSFGGAAIGIMPYTKMNYDYKINDANSDNIPIVRKFRGNGNINQLFVGSGVSIKQLSIGANLKYLFGELTKEELLEFLTSDYTNVRKQDYLIVRGLSGEFGLTYDLPLGETHLLSFGGTASLGNKIDTKSYQLINSYTTSEVTEDGENIKIENQVTGTVLFDTEDNKTKSTITLPTSYQAGVSLSKNNQYFIGIDYKNEAWDDLKINNVNTSFKRGQKIILGAEYLPNIQAKGFENYWKSISYRAGLNYGNSPITVSGQQLTEYGINFGFGFPLGKYKYESEKFGSYLFASFGYDKLVSAAANGINENYFKVNFSIVLNDKWFVKKKFD